MESTKERQKLAWEGLFYSNRRIDLLLVSISGGGIYACLETVKFLSEKDASVHWLIWISASSFLFTIIVNFIGQFVGKKANHYDYLYCDAKIEGGEDPNCEAEMEIKKYDELSDKFSNAVGPINIACTVLMIAGLTSILLYFLAVFTSV